MGVANWNFRVQRRQYEGFTNIMIIEIEDKNRTRKLYEEAFDDPEVFVDYYYKEKCRDNTIIANVEGDEVISMLHLNPYQINLCGKTVNTYYVVAVATTEKRRHQGEMTRLFDKAYEKIREEKIPFIFLMPVDEAIYSWMGFDTVCDFSMDRIADYDVIRETYDVYCVRDDAYIRRMNIENELREMDDGEVLPDEPVIMAKITDLKAFNEAAGEDFQSEKEALDWLKSKKIYICEEV